MRIVGWACYYIARGITWSIAHALWSVTIEGRENVPASGPFLLCPVHRSNVDGPLTSILTRRRMKYLAKETMFKVNWLAAVYRAMGAIPVNRGVPDRQSLQMCVQALEAGHPLVLFPEGGRRAGPVVEGILEGAAYLALRTGVPIIPVSFGGSARAHRKGSAFLSRARIRTIIGEAISFAKPDASRVRRSAIRDGTELLRARLQALFDESEGRPMAAEQS